MQNAQRRNQVNAGRIGSARQQQSEQPKLSRAEALARSRRRHEFVSGSDEYRLSDAYHQRIHFTYGEARHPSNRNVAAAHRDLLDRADSSPERSLSLTQSTSTHRQRNTPLQQPRSSEVPQPQATNRATPANVAVEHPWSSAVHHQGTLAGSHFFLETRAADAPATSPAAMHGLSSHDSHKQLFTKRNPPEGDSQEDDQLDGGAALSGLGDHDEPRCRRGDSSSRPRDAAAADNESEAAELGINGKTALDNDASAADFVPFSSGPLHLSDVPQQLYLLYALDRCLRQSMRGVLDRQQQQQQHRRHQQQRASVTAAATGSSPSSLPMCLPPRMFDDLVDETTDA